jgi:MscS family membrane protein
VIRRLTQEQDDRELARIAGPFRLLVLVVILLAGRSLLGLPLLARYFWTRMATALAIVAVTWLLVRLIDIVAKLTRRRLERTNRLGAIAILRLIRRLSKAATVTLGGLFLLYLASVNLTAALAGLGLGGIALAFAAQKTLENFFGGIMVISDQPVRVGDFCRFGDRQGTIEDIGLNSTRIRTLDRTVVSVPNGQLAAMSLENFALRDKIWFHPTIGLRYETTADQLRYVLAEVRKMLYKHPRVESISARIRFIGFGQSSLNLEVFAYVLTADYAVFLQIQEDLLLRIMDIIAASGTGVAFPSQTTYIARDSGLDTARSQAAVEQVRGWREQKDLPFPDFPPERIAEFDNTLEYPPPGSALRNRGERSPGDGTGALYGRDYILVSGPSGAIMAAASTPVTRPGIQVPPGIPGWTRESIWQRVIPGPQPAGPWPTGSSILSQVGAARRSRQEAWRAEFQLDGSANSKGATDA